MKRSMTLAAVAAALLTAAALAAPHDEVVLIVAANSDVTRLDSVELRKVFLGLTVVRDGRTLHGLRNTSDARLRQIFLQNVVSMSEISYERRLLELALRQGCKPPTAVGEERAVLRDVAADPQVVSFAWGADARGDPQVRVIKVLWRE